MIDNFLWDVIFVLRECGILIVEEIDIIENYDVIVLVVVIVFKKFSVVVVVIVFIKCVVIVY